MLPADALTINSLIINIKSSPLQNMKINNRDGKGYLSTRQTKSALDLSVYFGGRKKRTSVRMRNVFRLQEQSCWIK